MSINTLALGTWIGSERYTYYRKHTINSINGTVSDGSGAVMLYTPENIFAGIHSDLHDLTGESGMPARFAAVLMVFSVANTFEQALQEWGDCSIDKNLYVNCMCSHHIHQNFFIKNTINGNILVTGSSCILKIGFKEDLKTEIKRQANVKRLLDDNVSYVRCGRCGDTVVHPLNPHPYCQRCYSIVLRENQQRELLQKAERDRLQLEADNRIKLQRERDHAKLLITKESIENNRQPANITRSEIYAKKFDLTPEQIEKLRKFREDRMKPPDERYYI